MNKREGRERQKEGSVHRIFQARVLEWGAIAFSIESYFYGISLLFYVQF